MRKMPLAVLIIFALVIYGCAAPGKESFKIGQDLARQNRWEEARAMYEDALAKEPKSSEYLEALQQAKRAISKRQIEKARSILARTPLTQDNAMDAHREAEKALNLVPENKDAENLLARIKSELDNISKMAEAMYSEAAKAMEKNEWADAVRKLREINKFYPNYFDMVSKLKQTEGNALSYYLQEAENFKKNEEWGKAIKTLLLVQGIFPDNAEIAAGLKDARARHNLDYYLINAEECAKTGDWDRAMVFAQRAYDIGQPSDDVMGRVAKIRWRAGLYYIEQCRQHLSEKRLYSAYTNMSKALNHVPLIKNENKTIALTGNLLDAMAEKAASYEATGNFGNALMWYENIININQNYQSAFFKIQNLKGRIKERVIKKIAIMDFSPPAGNPDAGRRVTDSLLSYITTHASSDVKILARDVLGTILKEIEFGQAGLYDIESAKKAGKLKGTDIFIFGSVLDYNVEKNVSEGYKTVNAVVGKRAVPNPAYQLWLFSKAGKTAEEEKTKASPSPTTNVPPTTIDEDVRETVKYKVGTETKRATVGVSFKVIDVEEGEVVMTKAIKKHTEVKDNFSEGVSFANIDFDPLEIPLDAEILEKVTQEVASELGYEVLSRFQNLQVQYFNAAEMLKKKREYERAVEKYIDVIQIEEIKNISGPLSEKARKEIEELLKQVAL